MNKLMIILMTLVFGSTLFFTSSYTAAQDKSAKKILVVYYSRTGNTKRVAEEIAGKLGADIEQIIDKKDREGMTGYVGAGKDAKMKNSTEIAETVKNPGNFDLVIIGAPIWMGNVTPAVHTYLVKNKSAFKQVAFFCTAGHYGIETISKDLEGYADRKAIAVIGFNGDNLKPTGKAAYDKKMNEFISAISSAEVK